MNHKTKLLFVALCCALFAASGVLAQYNLGGFNFGQEVIDTLNEAGQRGTGKMTLDMDIEITARIAACDKDEYITEEEFNEYKVPHDVTNAEYVVFHYQHFFTWGEEGTPEAEKYQARVEELKANGCKFNTGNPPAKKDGCYDDDKDNPDRKGTTYVYGKPEIYTYEKNAANKTCNPCKYEDACGKEKTVVEYVCNVNNIGCKNGCLSQIVHKCPYGCYAGRCLTYKEQWQQQCEGQCAVECPSGTTDTGENGCPLMVKKCSYANGELVCEHFPQGKCCKKSGEILPENGTCAGICVNSSVCPEGYENKGMNSCLQDEKCYKSGWWGMVTTCNYTAKACCVAKPGAIISEPYKCEGFCESSGQCRSNQIDKGFADCPASAQNCHACGLFGLKQCCDYVPARCCEFPKPVTSCAGGMCTYNDCPGGMTDVGQADCGQIKECKTSCWGFCKKCTTKTAKCCVAADAAKCDKGTCQKDSACPAGYKSIGSADCGSYDEKYKCGFLKLQTCKVPMPKTCCVPE